MTGERRYTVVRAFPGFDVRRYPDSVAAEVRVRGSVARAVRRGSRPLLRYLGGDNGALTLFVTAAPVLQEAGETTHLVSVLLPDGVDGQAIPEPSNGSVLVSVVPSHEAAALRFSGRWSTRRLTRRGRELLASVRASGLEPAGAVYFARYDPAWKPGFLTRNEALVRVTSA